MYSVPTKHVKVITQNGREEAIEMDAAIQSLEGNPTSDDQQSMVSSVVYALRLRNENTTIYDYWVNGYNIPKKPSNARGKY